MSSFPTQARRVRDDHLPLRDRLLALRECALRFAPYGFRATWHHLILSAGLPMYLEIDPGSLVRAIDELELARTRWLAEATAFRLRRRGEKAAGLRLARRTDGWHAVPALLAFCPDPERHPHDPLATVVERLITAYRCADRTAPSCPVCATPSPPVGRRVPACPACGACRWIPGTLPETGDPGTGRPWPLIWQRAVRHDRTVGGGDFGQFYTEFTPDAGDPRFGQFLLIVRGTLLGDASTTALYPHYTDLAALAAMAAHPRVRRRRRMPLGDTFDYLDVEVATDETDLILTVTTYPQAPPPRWASPVGVRRRLAVPRTAVISAWQQAEPEFRRILGI